MSFFRKKTGNYTKTKKTVPLLPAVIVFGILFFAFLAYTVASGNTSAMELREKSGLSERDASGGSLSPARKPGLSFLMLEDQDETPLYDHDGNALFADERGNVFSIDFENRRRLSGWDGNPVYDEGGDEMYVDSYGNYYTQEEERRVLKDEYGHAIYNSDGDALYVDLYGNAYVRGASGEKELVAADGAPVTDLEGNRILLTDSIADAAYATGESVRTGSALAADSAKGAYQDTAQRAEDAYASATKQAAERTRHFLAEAAANTKSALQRPGGDLATDTKALLQDSAENVSERIGDVKDQAITSGNSWWSLLVNDWNKLKKDMLTPTGEFGKGNTPNPVEQNEYDLFRLEEGDE